MKVMIATKKRRACCTSGAAQQHEHGGHGRPEQRRDPVPGDRRSSEREHQRAPFAVALEHDRHAQRVVGLREGCGVEPEVAGSAQVDVAHPHELVAHLEADAAGVQLGTERADDRKALRLARRPRVDRRLGESGQDDLPDVQREDGDPQRHQRREEDLVDRREPPHARLIAPRGGLPPEPCGAVRTD